MTAPLWSPSTAAVKQSRLTAFSKYAEDHTHLEFADYAALHQWSVAKPGEFWDLFWRFAEIQAEHTGEEAVLHLDQFPGARWFPGAKLNFAENLLRERSDRPAFIALLENGARKVCTYNELYDQTAKVAQELKALGVQPGDRVAGWLPNIPEAAVAMLATSSLGGVWSSCSPDFGAPGALDRFGQIEPKVLFACDGYYYAGRHIDVRNKVREVAAQVRSITTIVWVSVLDAVTDMLTQGRTEEVC